MDGLLPWERRDFLVSRSQARQIWDYEAPAGFDRIDDCYGLNVARDGVWCYYYTDFPIARIDSDLRVRCWNTKLSGARTLAAANQKVLLYGGYGDRGTECYLLALKTAMPGWARKCYWLCHARSI